MLARRLACFVGALVAATASACTEPYSTLADLPSLQVAATALVEQEDADTSPARVLVTLEYDEQAFLDANGTCAVIHPPHATIGGVPLDLIEPGETKHFNDPPSVGCEAPQLQARVDLPRAEATELVIEDSSMTIRATYEAGTIVPRRARMVSPAEWSVKPGQIFTFEWSHPDDFDTGIQIWIRPAFADAFLATPLSRDGAMVTMRLPADTPRAEQSSRIDIVAGPYEYGDALTCSGPGRCIWTTSNTFFHALAIPFEL